MLEKVKKLKENKVLKVIYNILYFLLVVCVLLILFVVILQRVSNNNISLGGFRIFNIATGSMIPKYEIGDVLLSKSTDASEIEVGDDIVYRGEKGDFAGKIITHQVIEKKEENGSYQFQTKGIANEEADPIISESQVLGVVVYKIQTLSFISKIINNLYSFYFILFVPIVFLIFLEVRRIWKNIKEDQEKKQEIDKSEHDSDEEDTDDKKE